MGWAAHWQKALGACTRIVYVCVYVCVCVCVCGCVGLYQYPEWGALVPIVPLG